MQRSLAILTLLILCAGAGWWFLRPTSVPDTSEVTDANAPVETTSPAFAGLDEVKQKEIWDAEHVTFEIETHVGRRLVTSLQERSADALAEFYVDGFSGVVPNRTTATITEKMPLTETAFSVEAHGSEELDADGFSRFLIDGISAVPQDAGGRFRVLKIARVADGSNADTWELDVLLTLGGADSDGRSVAYVSHGNMQCRFSDDEDIIAGRIIESWHVDSESLRISGQELMEEVTSDAGLSKLQIVDNWECGTDKVRQYRFQTAVDDFNADGFPDIAVATADAQQFVLQWSPQTGQYQDVTRLLGLPTAIRSENRAYLACWIDFDDDGFVDLLLGETLFRNVEGKSFEPVRDNGGLKLGYNPMGSVVADYDGDGRLDLYVLYQRTRNGVQSDKPPAWVGDDDTGADNQLWKNRGDGTFIEKARLAGATGGRRHSFAATWLYANEDHYPDLYVANDFSRNSLLINQGDGSFRDVADESGVGDFATSMGVASGDINGDGTPEIYVANMYSKMGRRIIAQVSAGDYPTGVYEQLVGSCAGNRMYSTSGDVSQFQELSEQLGVNAVGWAYAPAFADFDGDGLLDLYATTGFLSFDRRKPDG
ncbi:MAG: VCBS repeat-containing protein [Planctomycetaceae bacterium]